MKTGADISRPDLSIDPEAILERGTIELDGATYKVEASITADEGRFIQRIIRETRPRCYLEIGLASGISALYAEIALADLGADYRHYIIDPLQADWDNLGIRMLRKGGFGDQIEFLNKGSELALPELLASGLRVDMAFIDGWHTFDHTLVDFFYINKMLRVGGVVIFDDANSPSVGEAVLHAESYPCYRRLGGSARKPLYRRLAAAAVRRSRTAFLPSAVALQKISEDDRRWDWYKKT